MGLVEAILEAREANYEERLYPAINRDLISRAMRVPMFFANPDGATLSGGANNSEKPKPALIPEFNFEKEEFVNIDDLRAPLMPTEIYSEAHKGLPIVCHDIVIEHNGGALLVNRDIHPAKDIYWCIGGRVSRGMTTEDSLRAKVRKESGLELEDLAYLGAARTFFKTAPFDHGKGTDTINLMFFGRGKGELKLNYENSAQLIVRLEDYKPEFRATLHPYIQNMMDMSMRRLGGLAAVVYDHPGIDHEDHRRKLFTAFNGDFKSEQSKFIAMKKDEWLGGQNGHYHNYSELYFMLKGECTFTLEDISTKKQRIVEMKEGDRLIIPPKIAHKVFARDGSILVGNTEKKYVSAAENDHPYTVA